MADELDIRTGADTFTSFAVSHGRFVLVPALGRGKALRREDQGYLTFDPFAFLSLVARFACDVYMTGAEGGLGFCSCLIELECIAFGYFMLVPFRDLDCVIMISDLDFSPQPKT